MDCKRHKWSSDWELVGGCRENPGIFGIGGAALRQIQRCAKCDAIRHKIFGDVNVPSRNHGWKIGEPKDWAETARFYR